MQLQRFKWFARVGVLASLAAFLVATAGCASNPPPPNGNGGNGDPPDDVEVTLDGDGMVDQRVDGTLVTLTAVPDPGWVFVGWSGAELDDPTAASITVDADEVPAITAMFEPEEPPPAACEIDADCDDGVYCNGSETCQ
ncbi:MAG: InlB B-repeat-containing protein, partial [Planctomycetota bacterium]